MSISAVEIIKAISDKLRALKYPIKDVDITKEIPRPCLVIEADGINDSKAAVGLDGERVNLVLYYFAQRREKGYVELLKCQKDIKQLFNGALEVAKGFYVTVNELDFNISKSDMALIATFEVYTVQGADEGSGLDPDEGAELMEELEVAWRDE